MTVKELIELLGEFDPNDKVYFAHPSHDYWRTTLASEVKYADDFEIQYSEYHQQMIMKTYDDDEEESAENTVVVLTSRYGDV